MVTGCATPRGWRHMLIADGVTLYADAAARHATDAYFAAAADDIYAPFAMFRATLTALWRRC